MLFCCLNKSCFPVCWYPCWHQGTLVWLWIRFIQFSMHSHFSPTWPCAPGLLSARLRSTALGQKIKCNHIVTLPCTPHGNISLFYTNERINWFCDLDKSTLKCASFTQSHTHTPMAARYQWEPFGLDMWTGAAGDQTANPAIGRRPALSPEPQLFFSFLYVL